MVEAESGTWSGKKYRNGKSSSRRNWEHSAGGFLQDGKSELPGAAAQQGVGHGHLASKRYWGGAGAVMQIQVGAGP